MYLTRSQYKHREPTQQWYNLFDFLLVVVSIVQLTLSYATAAGGASDLMILRIFRALRGLRAFRTISFLKKLRIMWVSRL